MLLIGEIPWDKNTDDYSEGDRGVDVLTCLRSQALPNMYSLPLSTSARSARSRKSISTCFRLGDIVPVSLQHGRCDFLDLGNGGVALGVVQPNGDPVGASVHHLLDLLSGAELVVDSKGEDFY